MTGAGSLSPSPNSVMDSRSTLSLSGTRQRYSSGSRRSALTRICAAARRWPRPGERSCAADDRDHGRGSRGAHRARADSQLRLRRSISSCGDDSGAPSADDGWSRPRPSSTGLFGEAKIAPDNGQGILHPRKLGVHPVTAHHVAPLPSPSRRQRRDPASPAGSERGYLPPVPAKRCGLSARSL